MPDIDFGAILSSAGSAAAPLSGVAGAINLSDPSWDLFILLFFVVGALLYGFTLGRERVIVLIVSMYMALAVIGNAPWLHSFQTKIEVGNMFAFQITTFLGVFLFLFFFLSRSALMRSLTLGDEGRWWHVLLFSFLQVGLLISMMLSYLPTEATDRLLEPTRLIFVSAEGRFTWIVLPIVAMMILRGKRDEKS